MMSKKKRDNPFLELSNRGYCLKVAPALHSHHSSAYCLGGASLALDMWYLLKVTLVPRSPYSRAVYCHHAYLTYMKSTS